MFFAIISLLTFSFGPIEDVNLEGCFIESVVTFRGHELTSEGNMELGGRFTFDPIEIHDARFGEYKAEIRITNESEENVFIQTGAAPLDVNGAKHYIHLPILVSPNHTFSSSIRVVVM